MKIKNRIIGKENQKIKNEIPKIKIRISKTKPTKIKKLRAVIPINLEIMFDAQTSRIFAISGALGYRQKYLCQWEKKVFNKKGIEK
jgi:hypothetical protein